MNCAVIGCKILQDELNKAIHETGSKYPVIWVDSEYHKDPSILRTKLQGEIDAFENVDSILFAFGCCGNGLVGLKASTANLIIPSTDDCISMVLSKPGAKFERQKHTYFVTKGWLESSKSIMKEYEHAVKRYGEQRAKRIFEQMLKHYNYLMLIETKAYNLEEWVSKAEELASAMNLELTVSQGDLWFVKKLLTGPYDDNFCFVPKGGTVNLSHFGYMTGEPFHQVL